MQKECRSSDAKDGRKRIERATRHPPLMFTRIVQLPKKTMLETQVPSRDTRQLLLPEITCSACQFQASLPVSSGWPATEPSDLMCTQTTASSHLTGAPTIPKTREGLIMGGTEGPGPAGRAGSEAGD